jgi:predicted DNA-binding protein
MNKVCLVKIDTELHRKLKIRAAIKGKNMMMILNELIEKYLNENEKK